MNKYVERWEMAVQQEEENIHSIQWKPIARWIATNRQFLTKEIKVPDSITKWEVKIIKSKKILMLMAKKGSIILVVAKNFMLQIW